MREYLAHEGIWSPGRRARGLKSPRALSRPAGTSRPQGAPPLAERRRPSQASKPTPFPLPAKKLGPRHGVTKGYQHQGFSCFFFFRPIAAWLRYRKCKNNTERQRLPQSARSPSDRHKMAAAPTSSQMSSMQCARAAPQEDVTYCSVIRNQNVQGFSPSMQRGRLLAQFAGGSCVKLW